VECIGKCKAAAPYEFGVKASIVTNNRRAPGGLFVLHARALPDNPYDGHTLRDVIDRTETLTGCLIERAYVDKERLIKALLANALARNGGFYPKRLDFCRFEGDSISLSTISAEASDKIITTAVVRKPG
jgi:hypothetical protein